MKVYYIIILLSSKNDNKLAEPCNLCNAKENDSPTIKKTVLTYDDHAFYRSINK